MGSTVHSSADRRFQFSAIQGLMVSAAFLLGVSPVSAQSVDVSDALARCAVMSDSAERLACFDRVAGIGEVSEDEEVGAVGAAPAPDNIEPARKVDGVTDNTISEPSEAALPPERPSDKIAGVTAGGPAAAPAAAEAELSVPAANVGSAVNGDGVREIPANPVPAGTASSSSPAPASGLGRRTEGNVAAVPPPERDHLSANVERIARQPHGEHIVFLDNNQVWVEEFKNSYFPVEIGDSVTIKKRRFGGFRLVTESGKAYRVKRLR